MLVQEALEWGRRQLKAAGVCTPALDALVLLEFTLGCSRVDLYREPERSIGPTPLASFQSRIRARARGIPVAYLTGEKEFMGLALHINESVLIPRPETELLVEKAAALLAESQEPVIVDVGTGSGAIAVSLADLLPAAYVLAIDTAEEILTLAGKNANRHQVSVDFYRGYLLEPIPAHLTAQVSLIAANLPYIPTAELCTLSAEVLAEPKQALNGGSDGLSFYRELVPQAARYLSTGGYLLCEIGAGQGLKALSLAPPPLWQSFVEFDLAGTERLLVAQKVFG